MGFLGFDARFLGSAGEMNQFFLGVRHKHVQNIRWRIKSLKSINCCEKLEHPWSWTVTQVVGSEPTILSLKQSNSFSLIVGHEILWFYFCICLGWDGISIVRDQPFGWIGWDDSEFFVWGISGGIAGNLGMHLPNWSSPNSVVIIMPLPDYSCWIIDFPCFLILFVSFCCRILSPNCSKTNKGNNIATWTRQSRTGF